MLVNYVDESRFLVDAQLKPTGDSSLAKLHDPGD